MRLLLVVSIGVGMGSAQTVTPPSGFAFYHEFFGPQGYADPQVARNLNLGIMTGLTFTPPVEFGVVQATRPYDAGLMLRLAGASQPAGMSDDAIARQRSAFVALAQQAPDASWLWNLLPEWDQSGGPWVPQGRPVYSELSRTAAHDRFLQYYAASFPTLSAYLRESVANRKYLLAAVTDSTPNVFDTYEMGVDVQLLERGIDELGDPSTGFAFLRGAANQYGRAWGVDLSTWRSGNGKATTYSASGVLLGGWSASYLRRLYYMAFFAGAQLMQNEAATYSYPGGNLNPFGTVTQEFADFALRRHPELGHPAVSAAVLISPTTGFDPKHGSFNQTDAVWYQDIPYSAGDSMMNHFFRLAFPNHWLHGLAPGAPFANTAGIPDVRQFQSYLAAGGDSRPYEPIPFTRWGDQFDVITTRVNADSLQRYKLIVLLGDVTLNTPLRAALTNWAAGGGVLVMNASQALPDDQALLGATIDNSAPRSSVASRWISNQSAQVESRYNYALVHPGSAEVWAVSGSGDPLITCNHIGAGRVLLTTPAYLQPTSRDGILNIGTQLLDQLFQQNARAEVTGPPIAYAINEAPGKLAVALFNQTGSEWVGRISVHVPRGIERVREYISDQPAEFRAVAGTVTVQARVPAYDLRVFAVEFSRKYAPRSSQNN